jgi:predicted AlkP superfamily pyrophosphatase or phosphodiesterase
MTDRLAIIILDALHPDFIRVTDMPVLRSMYEEHGEVLGISSIPHTAASNPLIWSGEPNTDKFWTTDPERWTDPANHFDRDTGEAVEDAETWGRDDFDRTFIWDDLQHHGYEAAALEVPIVLPPYSFNVQETLNECWFPDTEPRMKAHIRKLPSLIRDHAQAEYDFICSSIQMPDKWLHGVGEGKCTQEFMKNEASVLDAQIERMRRVFDNHGWDWVFMGDHGAPYPGALPIHETKQLIARHRKESVIISNLETPTYTGDLYSWCQDYFGVETAPAPVNLGSRPGGDVMTRLENLGYR